MRNVRKAEPDDSKIIADYLFSAMQQFVYTFIGKKDPEKAREFILHFVEKEGNQYSHRNCWVLEENARIVAAVNVYDGAQLVELRQPVVDYIRSHINKELRIEDETQAGEHYIDSVGVDLRQRGKGAGTQLLQFVIEELVNNRKQTLGLLVDEENPDASRLYLKLGFKHVGMKVLLGKNMEHLQIRACPLLRFGSWPTPAGSSRRSECSTKPVLTVSQPGLERLKATFDWLTGFLAIQQSKSPSFCQALTYKGKRTFILINQDITFLFEIWKQRLSACFGSCNQNNAKAGEPPMFGQSINGLGQNNHICHLYHMLPTFGGKTIPLCIGYWS